MNKVKTNKTLRHSEYYGMTQIFDELYVKSDKKEVFTELMTDRKSVV